MHPLSSCIQKALLLAVLPLLLVSMGAAAEEGSAAPLVVQSWHLVGPFSVGSREGFVHHLASPEGEVPETFTYEETWPSILVPGGRTGWHPVEPEQDDEGRATGAVRLAMDQTDWEARQDEWGFAGLLNAAYLHGHLEVPRDGLYLLEAARANVTVGGETHRGDPYGRGLARSVLALEAGRRPVLVRSAGFGGEREISVRFRPLEPNDRPLLVLEKDLLLPDLVVGRAGEGWAGVPLLNTTEGWLADVTVTVEGPGIRGEAHLAHPIAPRTVRKVPVPLTWTRPTAPAEGEEGVARIPIEVVVRASGEVVRISAEIVLRGPHDARRVTFLSPTDRSAQFYGLREPTGSEPVDGYGLVLSTHGAGVDARGQARAHAPKDWAWVAAPTNRRPYGFDWHDWGRLDFEEVWAEVMERHPVARDRVSLVGHSMGGHGAWILGVHHADLLASLTPSAGWNSHDLYVPDTLRRSRNLGPPELAELWPRATAPDRVAPWLENLLHVPVLAVHGSADDNVPPTHARLLVGTLDRLGYGAELREVPEVGHWWDLDEERPGADCVDASWLERHWRTARRPATIDHVVLLTPDLDLSRRMHWVEALEPIRTAETVRIEARRSGSEIAISTRNLRRLAVDLPPLEEESPRWRIVIDGDSFVPSRREADGRRAVFARRRGHWRRAAGEGEVPPGRALFPGGMKKTLFEPFLLVVGTAGDEARLAKRMHLARTLAHVWWRRANGHVAVVRDVDLLEAERREHNLVLIGGPETNHETRRIAPELTIRATEGGIQVGERLYRGHDLAAAHWQPDPRRPDRRILVFQASGAAGDTLLPSLNPIGSGVGLPDFLVVGPEVRTRSWAGFRAAGWWTPQFRLDPERGWLAPSTPR